MDVIRHHLFKSVLVNTASQIVNKFFGSTTTFVVTLLISYFLGVISFGSFIKITTFVTFFYLIVDFGINSIYIKNHYNATEKNFGNLLLLRLCIASILWVIVTVITIFLPYNPETNSGFSSFEKMGIFLYSLTLFTQSLELSLNSIYQKKLLFKFTVIPNVISSLVLLILVIWGIFIQNLLFILAAYAISEVVLFISSYATLIRLSSISRHLHEFKTFSQKLLASSFPLAIMLFLNIIYFRADTIILSLLKPTADVGIYGLAFKMFEFLITLPAFFANSVFPILVEKEKNTKEFKTHAKSYALFLLILSFLAIPCIYIAAPLLGFIKPEFTSSVTVIRILSLALPFFFLTSLFQWIMILKNKKKSLISIYLFSMIVNILLNVLFIPQYSYIAAAYITVLSEGIVLSAIFYVAKSEIF